jgi:hypothetical protein
MFLTYTEIRIRRIVMKRITLVSALALALVTGMSGAAHASTTAAGSTAGGAGYGSTYVAFEGPGFSGRTQVITRCGTTNIRYRGSYKWFGKGQSGRMHNDINARGSVHFTLPTDRIVRAERGVGWKSIFKVC